MCVHSSLSRVHLLRSMDCSLPGSSVHGISSVRILQWVIIPFSRGSSWPRYWTQVSCIGRRILYCLNHQGSPHVLVLRVNGHLSNRPPSCWKLSGDMLSDLTTLWFSRALTLERKLLEQSKYKIDSSCQALSLTQVEVKIRQSHFWLYRRRSFPPGWVLWTWCAWLLSVFQCS